MNLLDLLKKKPFIPVIFPDPAPSQSHSETSMAAAEAIEGAMPALRARVWTFFLSRPEGATDEQAQVCLAMNPSTERPRRVELCDRGMLEDSGRTAETHSGRLAVLWVPVAPERWREVCRDTPTHGKRKRRKAI